MLLLGIRLEIVEGPDKGLWRERPASGHISIGREVDPNNDLCIEHDMRVSRLHVEIEASEQGCWVIDHSRNGTARDDELLPARERVRLRSGDRLQLGPYTIVEFQELAEAPEDNKDIVPPRPDPARETHRVLEPVARFGDFDIYGAIASSESDRVDRAVRRGTGVEVALKQYTYKMIAKRVKRDIQEEAERARDWEHPNIARFVESGEHEETLFVATQFIDGEVLSELLDRRGPEIDACLATYVVREACLAIAYVLERQRDYVHRYLSPRCLMLDRNGRVVLINYGSPPFAARISPSVSGGRYQANEGKLGGRVDARADVCSLGRILYELLSKEAIDPTKAALPLLEMICTDAPIALAKITNKAVSVITQRRFPTTADMAEELTRALADLDPHYGPEAAAAWMARFCRAT